MGKTLVLAIALTTVCMTGCEQKARVGIKDAPLVAKVTIDAPGALPEMLDTLIFPLFQKKVAFIPHVRTFTCISRQGAFEGYVVADPNADIIELQDRLYSALSTDRLLPSEGPAGLGQAMVRFARNGVPKVTPKDVSMLNVAIDRDKLFALGLAPTDVEACLAQLSKEPSNLLKDGKPVESVGMSIVVYKDGRPVRLRDIATFQVVKRPDCIVRTYPTNQ